MAKDSKILNVGDSLIVVVNPKAKGRIRLTDYQDELIGLTDSRVVKREFRIIDNDVFATEWLPMNTINLRSIDQTIETNNIIQIRYTRTGTDSSGEIEFVKINFMGTFQAIQFEAPTINSSIFSNVINSEEVQILEKNLFKKLYFRGVIPNYITRGDNLDKEEDRDYIALFSSISKFFAMFIQFFKRFESFDSDFDLMREWVRQNGIYFDESSITLEELQYFSQNFYDEIRKRGTKMIFSRKGDILPDGSIIKIDGEFIRLIRSKRENELLYENTPLSKSGWCMGQISPMYRGTSRSKGLNKTKEDTEDFQNLNNFVHFVTQNGKISLEKAGSKNCVSLKTSGSGSAGLGRINESVDVVNNLYVADPKMDYEITFSFNINQSVREGDSINFGIEGFDGLKNKLNDAFILPNGDAVSEMFLDDLRLNKFIKNKWYFVRGIIHAYSSDNVEESKTNIGFGNNLYFNNSFVKYILPKIYINSSYSSNVYLWDYKIRPLVRGTNILPLKGGRENSHSLGFIQCPKLFYMYIRNNNNSQSEIEITDIIEKYLLPYGMTDILTYIGNE